jgi:hypothetical protein
MEQPSFDPGLTQKFSGRLRRFINKDGTFNVRRQGATWRATHPYLYLINMPWPTFLATVFVAYVVVNTLFAVAYFLVGIDQIQGAQQARSSHKSVIMIFMPGGPSHLDLYDLKSEAPVEVRGEFRPIRTAVSGIEICEHLPKLARIMDKLVPIRTIVGCKDDHAGYQCFTGHLSQNAAAGGWPHIGSSASRLQGPVAAGIPPFVSLCYVTQHKPYNEPSAATASAPP